MKTLLLSTLAFSLLVVSKPAARAAAPAFQDLNFESATIAAAPANYTPQDAFDPISAAAALPGWTVYEDTTQCTAVWGAPYALDETSVALVHNSTQYPATPIDGTYSVELTSIMFPPGSNPQLYQTSSISQTGLVPAGMRSIQFSIAGAYGYGPFVSLGGTRLTLSTLSTTNGVTTMAADISAFAGKSETLTFSSQGGLAVNQDSEGGFGLDDIRFSTSAVPEPGTCGLLAVGTLGIFARLALRRRARSTPR